ncbi:erythromycin esterase family protein [Capnocytophaga canis]|uniref:erythromycin esterase family protein n=1 Tax=Capnocytophaga canis TaxID=1848903 RepID=UPI00370DB978
MTKQALFFIAALLFSYANAQVQTISKSDYEKADFTNVTTLQNDLKNVRIVGLGESSHFMGETYVSKIKIVKYLHQHCGFDVIAIESPLYDLKKYYNETIKTNQVKTPWHFTEISSVWITDDMYELFDYILETQKTDRPLIYTGFDEKLFYRSDYKLNDDYNEFLKKLNADTDSNIKTDSLFKKALDFTADYCYYFTKVPPKDTLVLHNTFSEVKKALNKLETKNGYYYFWERMTENIKSLYRFNYKNLSTNRDEQMAKNVSYLANHEFPDKKIILWAASIHLMDNITNIENYKKNPKNSTMGYFLRKEFKDQYYVIGFVPATGVTGFKGYLGLGKFKPKAKKGSFERYILDKYNPDYAFISLRNELSQKEITKNNIKKSNLLGLTPYEMDMLSVVDAFFYLKEEHLVSFEKRKAYFKKEREDLERTADTSNK